LELLGFIGALGVLIYWSGQNNLRGGLVGDNKRAYVLTSEPELTEPLKRTRNMTRIEQARRNNRRKERLAALPETILGIGLIVISVATFVGICLVGG
jgi:hypothetical protein